MKWKLIIVFFIIGLNKSFAQFGGTKLNGEQLQQITPKRIQKFDPDLKNKNEVYFSVPFAGAQIENKKEKSKLKDKIITKVQLYYSSYKLSKDFSQPVLNKSRFDSLLKLTPGLKSNTFLKWEVFEQSQAKNEAEAKKLFHGFRIVFVDAPTESSAKDELEHFKKMLSIDSLGHFENVVVEKMKITKKTIKKGYDPILKSKREKNIVLDKKGLLGRKEHNINDIETTYVKKIVGRKYIPPGGLSLDIESSFISPLRIPFVKKNIDTTVIAALKRIKINPENTLMVLDVTGSMSPYSIQVCLWNRLNFKPGKPNYFVLFNDGDRKKTSQKNIGSTGGIYTLKADSAIDLEKKIIYVMEKGFGGDIPENNLEAVIQGIKKFPFIKQVIMIADNYSPVRDMALLEKIKIPVKVIVCGAYDLRYSCDYLNIAKATNGSIHTLKTDLLDISKTKEGDVIELNGYNYKLSKGKFIPIL